MPGPLVFIFLLAKELRGKAFTKQASLYLVVSAGLLAILLTASRQFNWLDVLVSTAAMLPVVLGMYAGQHMRDKIAPETFEKLVLIAGHCRGRRVAATWFLQPVGWVEPTGPARSGRPDDGLRETYHLQLCRIRAVTNYRRNFICGISFFFTANLAERRLRRSRRLHRDLLHQSFRHVRRRHPFDIEAIVVLPDHLHAIWTLPED